MRELVFLLEEPSARAMLETLLPRLLESAMPCRLVPFEGKQDLERNITRRIRGYQNPQARFIVVRDLDSHPDCRVLKRRLLDLCAESGKGDACLVRIACQELKTFYLADLQAVEAALGLSGLVRHQANRKFRDPDRLGSPSHELRQLTGRRYEKVAGSREIGRHLALDNQRSASFRHLVDGVRRLAQTP